MRHGLRLEAGEAYTSLWRASMREADDSDRVQCPVVVIPAAAGFLFFRYAGIRSSIVVARRVAPRCKLGFGVGNLREQIGYLRARLRAV